MAASTHSGESASRAQQLSSVQEMRLYTCAASLMQYLALVEQASEAELRVTRVWHGHDLEAWVVAADCHQASLDIQ